MNIDITARHFELTGAIRDYAERRTATLEHLNPRITGARVIVEHDDHHSGRQYVAKVHLTIPRGVANTEASGSDIYEAIDLATEKMAAQLRREHGRRSTKAGAELANC